MNRFFSSHPTVVLGLVTALLSGATGCATGLKGTGAEQGASSRNLEGAVRDLARQAQEVLRAQDERLWAHWVDGKPLDIEATYRGRDALFTARSVETIRKARDKAQDPREVRALTHLLSYVAAEALAHALKTPSETLAVLEASLTFGDGRREYPLAELDRTLSREKNGARRQSMYRSATPAFERLAAQTRRKLHALQAALPALGYRDVETFGAELRQAEFDAWVARAESTLQETQARYLKTLDTLARQELQNGRSAVQPEDLPYLFRSPESDSDFPAESVLARAEQTARGLGFDVLNTAGLRWDARPVASRKSPPLALAVTVPSDVRISLKPVAGFAGQAAVLHEMGLALRAAFTSESRFELAKLGNGTSAKMSGLLFEGLTETPAWLEGAAGLQGEALARHAARADAAALYRLRVSAARLIYQVRLLRHGIDDIPFAQALYREVMGPALGVAIDEDALAHCFQDVDTLYSAVDTFRAQTLAAELRASLSSRFGPTWWKKPETGQALKALWSLGNAVPPERLMD